MNRFMTAATSLVAMLLTSSSWATSYAVDELEKNGPTAERLNIVILGDGYRDVDQTTLTQHARAAMDRLWTVPAFGDYRKIFNVRLVHTISNVAGIKQNPDEVRSSANTTIFNSYFLCTNDGTHNCDGTPEKEAEQRLIYTEYSLVNNVLMDLDSGDGTPWSFRDGIDIAVVLVNEERYGGSGGYIPVSSAAPDAPDVVIHEFGHAYGGLADEYTDTSDPPSTTEPDFPNATIILDAGSRKWGPWILPVTPVPTPEPAADASAAVLDVVGLFEGANRIRSGEYRPWAECKMRAIERPFCPVCTEAIILGTHKKINLPSLVTPAASTVDLGSQDTREFSYFGPDAKTLTTTWQVDGQTVGQSARYMFSAVGKSAGAHNVTLTIRDTTRSVLTDREHVLSRQKSWVVNVLAEPCTPARTITGGQSGNFGTTGPYCFRTNDVIHGWGCNFTTRTVLVNDEPRACGEMSLPAPVNGYTYFEISDGSADYDNIWWW